MTALDRALEKLVRLRPPAKQRLLEACVAGIAVERHVAPAAWMAAWWLTESVPLAATATLALFLLLTTVAVSVSCAFMLPVATPPKAIVFASGHVTIAQMGRAGFVMNLFAIAAITALVSLGSGQGLTVD